MNKLNNNKISRRKNHELSLMDEGSLVTRQISHEIRSVSPIDMPRSQAAYETDATFVLNKKSGLFTYYPDIHSPGLPQNVRRLVDLRLEC